MENAGTPVENGDDGKNIVLANVIGTVWQSRWTVVIITALVAACFYGWSAMRPGFLSYGYVEFGLENIRGNGGDVQGFTASDYGRYTAPMMTAEWFDAYVEEKKLALLPGVDELRKKIRSTKGISHNIEPVISFRRLGPNEAVGAGDRNNVIGMRIRFEGRSPETAQQAASLLGEYALDTIIHGYFDNFLVRQLSDYESRMASLKASVARNNVSLEALGRNIDGLKKIRSRNSEEKATAGGQPMFVIDKETIRFLPVTTQITAAEIHLTDMQHELEDIEREIKQNAIRVKYVTLLKDRFAVVKSGVTFLKTLDPVKEELFRNMDMNDVAVKHLYYAITAENDLKLTAFLKKSRYIVNPELPVRANWRPGENLLLGILAGIFVSLFWVFGRHTWRARSRAA
jgi:hypothetical protein